MGKFDLKYFLAANSAEGFYSVFDRSYAAEDGYKAYIIKGGPGTGKSSFMKYLAVKAADKGLKTVLCPCSSDPMSLDAVILPEIKIVIMDGTAPHTVDPVFPGVCEKILNFGDFWKPHSFEGQSEKIISLTLLNKAYHKTTARYIAAAGKLLIDNYQTAEANLCVKKAEKFADSICKKYIKSGKKGYGREWVRFISGITPIGVVSYADTVLNEAEKTVIIEDKNGAAASVIINRVKAAALKAGYEVITLKNPFLPSLITDHIIIPELSFAIATENSFIRFSRDVRRIHARRFLNTSVHGNREKMRFNKRTAKELLQEAAKTLDLAKLTHDKLEAYYINAMDFNALTAFTEGFSEEILK